MLASFPHIEFNHVMIITLQTFHKITKKENKYNKEKRFTIRKSHSALKENSKGKRTNILKLFSQMLRKIVFYPLMIKAR